ncbi:MAG TPA: hypothetical protein GX702_07695, partial [Chloroflexi bacterium]|nr:hypothetical protein [Chloroflexota bacterium]
LMGLCVLIVLLLSNLTISLISKFVSDQIRVPVYIMIIATFVTNLDMFLQFYVEPLSKVLGIYIPVRVGRRLTLPRRLFISYSDTYCSADRRFVKESRPPLRGASWSIGIRPSEGGCFAACATLPTADVRYA